MASEYGHLCLNSVHGSMPNIKRFSVETSVIREKSFQRQTFRNEPHLLKFRSSVITGFYNKDYVNTKSLLIVWMKDAFFGVGIVKWFKPTCHFSERESRKRNTSRLSSWVMSWIRSRRCPLHRKHPVPPWGKGNDGQRKPGRKLWLQKPHKRW